jgi:uncharacterized protein (TIGR03437 family)
VKTVAISENGDIYVGGDASINGSIAPPDTAYQRRIDTACPHESGVFVSSPVRASYMTDVWFARLDANASSLLGGTLFGGACVESLEHLTVVADGSVILIGQGYSDPLPATEPVALPPLAGDKSVFVARFDSRGSSLLTSTYVQPAERARIAGSGDAVALITSPSSAGPPPSIWKIALGLPSQLSIAGVRSAFAPVNTPIVPGSIVIISVTGLPEDVSEYLGLNPTGGARAEIGGVTVTFDGLSTPLLGVRPGEIIGVAPAALRTSGPSQVSIRTATGAQGTIYADTAGAFPALYPDIRNADGTLNAPGNPAIAGSNVTIFLTGVPPPETGFRDGELVSHGGASSSFTTVLRIPETGQQIEVRDVRPVAGFIFGLYSATIRAPVGNGELTMLLPGRIPTSARINVRATQ